MIDKVLIFFSVALFSSFHDVPSKPLQSTTDWAKLDLKSRVKSVTEEQCRLTTGPKEIKNCKIKLSTVFNSEGYKVEEQMWEYNQLIDRNIFMYDEKNVLLKMESVSGKTKITYLFEYDERGNRIEEKISTGDSQPDSRYTYQYDKEGRKIQMEGYNMKTGGNRFIRETFTYDNFGNVIKATSENPSSNWLTESSYIYDQRKRLVQKTSHTNYEKLGKYLTTIRYTYDSNDNVVREDEVHNGRKSKTTITLDKAGNWVKRIETESRSTFLTKERLIEYF